MSFFNCTNVIWLVECHRCCFAKHSPMIVFYYIDITHPLLSIHSITMITLNRSSICLLATANRHYSSRQIYQAICTYVDRLPSYDVSVRMHPMVHRLLLKWIIIEECWNIKNAHIRSHDRPQYGNCGNTNRRCDSHAHHSCTRAVPRQFVPNGVVKHCNRSVAYLYAYQTRGFSSLTYLHPFALSCNTFVWYVPTHSRSVLLKLSTTRCRHG